MLPRSENESVTNSPRRKGANTHATDYGSRSAAGSPGRNARRAGTAEGFFQEDLLSLARRHLKSFLEMSLELEWTACLGCGSQVRTPNRRDYRNGYYYRDLATGFGLLQDLRVPRSRKGGCQPSLFERY